MLIIPTCRYPKPRNDLYYLNKELFGSLWIECNLNNSTCNTQMQLINLSYNPKKVYYHQFIEKLSTGIDYAIVENKPLTKTGDYNINNLNQREWKMCTAYVLTTINTDQPTRISIKSKSLIDYAITDYYNAHSFSSFVSDTSFGTSANKPIDHFATSEVSDVELQPSPTDFMKQIDDKMSYKRFF